MGLFSGPLWCEICWFSFAVLVNSKSCMLLFHILPTTTTFLLFFLFFRFCVLCFCWPLRNFFVFAHFKLSVDLCRHWLLCFTMCVAFMACGFICFVMLIHVKGGPNQRGKLAWKHRKCLSISVCRLCAAALPIFMQPKYFFPPQIWAPWSTAMLVRSLPMKSRKKVGSWHNRHTHVHLVHDVADTDCQTQNGGFHRHVFMTFNSQKNKKTTTKKQDLKSNEKLQWVFFCCCRFFFYPSILVDRILDASLLGVPLKLCLTLFFIFFLPILGYYDPS